MTVYQHCGKSLKGAGRKRNEDRWLTRPLDDNGLLLVVADGLGGHPGGDVAAQMIIDSINHFPFQSDDGIARQLQEALLDADSSLTDLVEQQPELRGMGATATAVHIGGRQVSWAHIGDSRLYLLRGTVWKQVTRDHTYVQHLMDTGELTEKEFASHPLAHVLEQCIGAIDNGIDSGTFSVEPGDYLILCSDGIHKGVSEERLASFFGSELSLTDQVDRLLQIVSRTDKHDDATVIVSHVD